MALYDRLDAGSREAEDYFLLGRALVRLGRTYEAFPVFESAREKDPDHPEALAALAALYMRSDRFLAAAETAMRLAHQPQWEARAQLILGTARSGTQDPAAAALALRRWAELDPEGRVVAPNPAAEIRKLLARSYLQSGQPAEARSVLETMLKAGPDPEASWLLSRCFIQEKDWKRAAAALEQAPNFRTDHPLVPEPAPYVGEARCAECHRAEFNAVLASRHATTFARSRALRSFPLPKESLRDPGNPDVTHELRREGESLIVETRANQKTWRAIVDYAFGSADHFTTFVGKDDRGQSRMVRMSYYQSPRGTGWDIATGLPLQPIEEDEYLGKKMFAGDGVRRCLNCHTTNVQSILRETGPEAADRSIGCEKCHGPAGHHIAAVAAGFSDLAIDSPGEALPADLDQICAKCHGMHQPEGLDLPRTDPIWLRFQSLTLTWSRCYAESDRMLGCVTCHDPHRNVETTPAWYDAKCLSCHSADSTVKSTTSPSPGGASRGAASSGRSPLTRSARTSCPVNPTRDCVGCHLPRIWVQSTHSFKADHYIRVHDRPPLEVVPAGATGRAGHE
jgi:tetratricopeptide (TPR) repeat protein